jgi:hypothetical protein
MSFSWVKKNCPMLSGSALTVSAGGWSLPISLSLPTGVDVELGCENSYSEIEFTPSFTYEFFLAKLGQMLTKLWDTSFWYA